MKFRLSHLAAIFFLIASCQFVCAESSDFHLSDWKSTRGQVKNLKSWAAENPSPYRSYYTESSKDCAERWHISLGPLGINTLMHDRSWFAFGGVRQIYPKVLTDQLGAAFNAFEVKIVKRGSPAEGILKEGDLLIKMDNQMLLGAQHMFLGQSMDNKNKRGIEIHAGQLIDKAEGRGEIKITYLRLPDDIKSTPLKSKRAWQTIKQQKVSGQVDIQVALDGTGMFRLRTDEKRPRAKCQNLEIVNEKGQKIVLKPMSKRSDELNQLFELPAGTWILTTSIEAKKETQLTIERLADAALPQHLEKYLHTATLKLDAIGSFGDDFDPKGTKARNYAAMLAHRLAVQQNKDGSWSAKSYASPSFYTSVCGLALLSTDNPLYDANIKLAAQYVANAGERDKWTYSNAMWLMFLSEYYLKTKDDSILPALKMHVANCRRFILSDYTAGHSYARPGYGGGGYIGGGGVIACALAIASHTPVMGADDLAVLDKMLERVQEIAPGGRVPYGRVGKGSGTDYSPGQGGSCGTGPYFIASLVRGGAELFMQNATKRYSTAPFGSAENGHATQTLHFVWSCLSSANCGPEAHRENMNAYLWKFTTLREFDGTVNKNNYSTEYHNGDGVIGEPYWRTAGYLLIMNAYRKNLVITGAPQYRHAPRHTAVVFHHDRALHNEALRNWALVEAYLTDQAMKIPAQFTSALKQLRSLKTAPDLGEKLRAFLKEQGPAVAKAMMQLENDPKHLSRGQLAELILGVYFQGSCYADLLADPDEELGAEANKEQEKISKKEAKAKIKKRQKLIAQGKIDKLLFRLKIRPISRFQADPEAKASDSKIATAVYKMENLTVEVIDPKKQYLTAPLKAEIGTTIVTKKKRGKPDPNEGTLTSFVMKPGDSGSLVVHVRYNLAGIPISYQVPLNIPEPEARGYIPMLTRIPVKGTVVEDYSDSYSPRILLETGHVIGCEHRNHPARYLLAGSKYDFQISPGSAWGHDLRVAKPLTPEHRLAKVVSLEGIDRGEFLKNQLGGQGIKLTEGKKIITMTLEKEQAIQRVYLSMSEIKGNQAPRVRHTFEAMVNGQWQLLRNGYVSGLMPTITRKTNQVRLTLEVPKNGVCLDEVHLITPPLIKAKPEELSW